MGGCHVSQGENCFEQEHNINVKIIPLCDLFGTHGGVGIRAFCAFVAVSLAAWRTQGASTSVRLSANASRVLVRSFFL